MGLACVLDLSNSKIVELKFVAVHCIFVPEIDLGFRGRRRTRDRLGLYDLA